MEKITDNNESTQSASHDDNASHTIIKECSITYDQGNWFLAVTKEGIAKVRDSLQIRSLLALILRAGNEVIPSDIEATAREGNLGMLCVASPELTDTRTSESDNEDDEDSTFFASDKEDSTFFASDKEDSTFFASDTKDSGAEQNKSDKVKHANDDLMFEVPLDYRDHVDEILPRHTGPLGDEKTIRDIESRIKVLKSAVKMEILRKHKHKEMSLREEIKALETFRNEYYDPRHRNPRLFYTVEANRQGLRCRMLVLHALKSLAKDLPQTSRRLMTSVHRGASFYCEEMHDLTFRLVPLTSSLPTLGKQADNQEDKQKAAA
jgi:hypothetical protein